MMVPSARMRALVDARNSVNQALRRFDNAHVVTEPTPVSDALRDAAADLMSRLDAILLAGEL